MSSSRNQPSAGHEASAPAAAHTPGPWCVEDPMAPDSIWIVQAGKSTYEWWPIAVCNMPDEEDHLFTGTEVHANARLIAAAPDLLANEQKNLATMEWTRKRLQERGITTCELDTAIEQTRAAIAAATGNTASQSGPQVGRDKSREDQ